MSDELETNTRVFTLRIWLEQRAKGKRSAKWRGHITNVLTGSEQYFEDLDIDEIVRFIVSDMEHITVRMNWLWRALFWLLHRRKRPIGRRSVNEV